MNQRRPYLGTAATSTVLLGSLFLPAGVATADWLDLRSGEHLRGLGLEQQGGAYRFTLETGEPILIPRSEVFHLEKSSPGEKVDFRGRQMTLRRKIELLQKERQARAERMVQRLERWAQAGQTADDARQDDARQDDARQEFAALPAAERATFLSRCLRKSRIGAARRLAVQELTVLARDATAAPRGVGKPMGKREMAFALARAAIVDPYRSVRKESLTALKTIAHPDTATFFIPALRSRSSTRRQHAADALAVFPDRRAAAPLVDAMRYTWSAFGRSYFFQGTQRAYVADYELVSGGTGFSIVEVADPVVRTMTTGVVLDAHVERVEVRRYRNALRKITGQDFGTDFKRWKKWLAEHPVK